MLADGWTVFDTTEEFPDFLCVKGGRMQLVKVYNKNANNPARVAALAAFRKAGVDVEVKGAPPNPDHNGTRFVTSISVKAENKLFYEKLQRILESKGKDVSQWFNEQMVSTVMEETGNV